MNEFVEYAYIVCTCKYPARDFKDLVAHLDNGHELDVVANWSGACGAGSA